MKNLFILVLLFFSKTIFSQDLQNANWVLGKNQGLNFTSTTASPSITNPNIFTTLNSASVSDQQGNLLFYTDGDTVWNANGAAMANGTGLANQSSNFTQNIVIVPNPLDIKKYYLFSMSSSDNFTNSNFLGLRFTEIDMSTVQGSVIAATKNTPLFNGLPGVGLPIDNNCPLHNGKITSAKHSNGLDYWLIAEIGNTLISYLIDDTGVHFNNSSMSPLPSQNYLSDISSLDSSSNGPIKISPDNSKLLLGFQRTMDTSQPFNLGVGRLFVGQFNNSTGVIFNFLELNDPGSVFNDILTGAEFSPNGNIIHRVYDLYEVSSEVTLSGNTWNETNIYFLNQVFGFRKIQRTINGKIYIGTDIGGPTSDVISTINNPNSPPYEYQFGTIDVGAQSTNPITTIPQWVQWQSCHRYLVSSNQILTSINEERNNWIKTSDIITLNTSVPIKVIYHAGDYVELNPGFEAVFGCQFSSYIEGCTASYNYRSKSEAIAELTKELDFRSSKKVRGFSINPNPSSNSIEIRMANVTLKKVEVQSIYGKTVYEKTVDNQETTQIDISSYENGLYLVSVFTEDGQVLTEKLIKK